MSTDHARKVQRLRVLSGRLNRMIENGSFYDLPFLKRHGLIRRVKRLYGSLVGPVSPALLRTVLAGAATIVIGACVPVGGDAPKADNPSFAAPVQNPFGLAQVAYASGAAPAFADADGDGDADLFVGGGAGGESNPAAIWYFENDGTATAPIFQAPGSPHPDFSTGSYYDILVPVLAPIDGDADFDAFVGHITSYGSTLQYYENDPPGTFNPASIPPDLDIVGADQGASVTFVDIDGDGDLDAFVSITDSYDGNSISYHKNTGSAAAPVFEDQGPLTNLAVLSNHASPTFVDIDADGDFDAFVTDQNNVLFFRNTGTPSAPAFAAAVTNPFSIAGLDYSPTAPAFMDIDADGDFDLFVGDDNGDIWFFENTNL